MPFSAPSGGSVPADIWAQILSIMQGSGGNQQDSGATGTAALNPFNNAPVTVPPNANPFNAVGGSLPPGANMFAGGGGGGGGGAGGGSGGGVYAPFGQNPGGQGGADSPPAWLAKAALAAYQSGNTAYFNHLLADPTIQGDPHLLNFIKGLMQGNPDRIAEAQHYSTNPSYNGWNDAAGDGIAGDGK